MANIIPLKKIYDIVREDIKITDVINNEGFFVDYNIDSTPRTILHTHKRSEKENLLTSGVYEESNTTHCFYCNKTYTTIDYVALKRGETNIDKLVLDLALEYRKITEEEYQYHCSRKEYKPVDIKRVHKKISKPRPKKIIEQQQIASPEILHSVFSVFSQGMALIKQSKLSKKDMEYLLNRGLNKEVIENIGFFTIPKKIIMKNLLKKLKDLYNFDENILTNIPGFYKETNGSFTFKERKGIGIPIYNANKLIIGIQIRRNFEFTNTQIKAPRYSWFSSRKIPIGCSCGTSCGSPIDVYFPDSFIKSKPKKIFITEGKFKEITLYNKTKSPSLSVQGVGTWKGIEKILSDIQSLSSNSIEEVYICYDGDTACNTIVMHHAMSMAKKIQELFPNLKIFYCIWKPAYGKGIDDLFKNNHQNIIKTISKEKYEPVYLNLLKILKMQSLELSELSPHQQEYLFSKYIYNNF